MEPKYLVCGLAYKRKIIPFPFLTLKEPISVLSVFANAHARDSCLFLRVQEHLMCKGNKELKSPLLTSSL